LSVEDVNDLGRTTGQAERQCLPDPATLTGRLLLANRGDPSVPYFDAVDDAGGAFIVCLTRSYDPWVGAAWIDGRRLALPTRRRLSRVLAEHAGRHADLDVEFIRGRRVDRFRVVVVPGRDEAMTRLCTNLPRTPFSAPLVARLYRFRWQIELCFKEWKSYANLHKFDTANPHIAAGLIWATAPWPARSWAALSGYPLAAAGSSGGGERRDAARSGTGGRRRL
jgi:hypothetical protein